MFYSEVLPTLSCSEQLSAAKHADEAAVVAVLLASPPLSKSQRRKAADLAAVWIENIRADSGSKSKKNMLTQFDLSSAEGICLLSMAEALLRIPDTATINDLVADKLSATDWSSENAPISKLEALGLNLSGRFLQPAGLDASMMAKVWTAFCRKSSGVVIRNSLAAAMRVLSEEFILGNTIDAALKRAQKINNPKFRYSFDMLGEVARTQADADRYFASYIAALDVMSKTTVDSAAGILAAPSISVKLSSLHPRYDALHWQDVVPALSEKLLALALKAKSAKLGLTVDAEEADLLDLSLWIFSAVFKDKQLSGWDGFGLAVQAYQKRTPIVLDYLAELAQSVGKRIPVRLIKGAYWDSEIKHAQVAGLHDYPVFTRREATDLNYLACAKKLLELNKQLPAQFGTHNAYTAAAVLTMIDAMTNAPEFEFQHLHGMGDALHTQLTADKNIFSRVYAPVGIYADLLPYLVRRLLENGANSAFVHQIANPDVAISELVQDPVDADWTDKRHSKIPLPQDIYATHRNSMGVDLTDLLEITALEKAAPTDIGKWQAKNKYSVKPAREVFSPVNSSLLLGAAYDADVSSMRAAISDAFDGFKSWSKVSVDERAVILNKVADKLEENLPRFVTMLSAEAGRLVPDAIDEVREAADFCRYYAQLAQNNLREKILQGPTGEDNRLRYTGRGVAVCISPWNFPLAIFIGQIVSCLASGNAVVAKPAEQTSLIAAAAIDCCYAAGVPEDVLKVVFGEGAEVCNDIWNDKNIQAVLFTGSIEVATIINSALANRDCGIIPFVAETGGINALIADSSALTEQLINDVLRSTFNSAGQRCSALRVLCLQDDAADRQIEMLVGAMQCLNIADPKFLSTDVGPVIDADAQKNLLAYQTSMQDKLIFKSELAPACAQGYFVAPAVYEIDNLNALQKEVFGPILHIYRYKRDDVDSVVEQINAWGYGLTFGIHSRIESFVKRIEAQIDVGNIYINRNIVGAVVGVQPFGGCGLSGTGPKAGGPDTLTRLSKSISTSIDTTAVGGNASLLAAV